MDGFDLFEDVGDVPADPFRDRRLELVREFGEEATVLPAGPLLKPGVDVEALRGEAVYLFVRARVWLVEVDAKDERDAARVGRLLRRSLVARRDLPASEHALHALMLVVVHAGGAVRLPGKA